MVLRLPCLLLFLLYQHLSVFHLIVTWIDRVQIICVLLHSMLSSKDDLLYNQIKNAHQQEMAIAEKIKLFLEQKYEKTITNDELTFLVIHIARIIQD